MRATQYSFTRGQVGEDLDFRSDIQLYQSAAKTVDNMIVLPQGGLQKRRGFEFIGDAEDALKIERFSFSESQEYVIVFYNGRFDIYFEGVKVFDSFTDVFVLTDFANGTFTIGQTLIINSTTITLSSGQSGQHAVDAINAVTGTTGVSAVLIDNFVQLYNNGSGNIVIGSGTANSGLGFNAGTYSQVTSPYTTDTVPEIKTTQKFDAMFLVQKDTPPQQLVRGVSHYDWSLTELDFDSIPFERLNIKQTLTPSGTTGNINLTLSSGSAYWTANHIGVRVRVNDGYAEITGRTSGLVATATVVNHLGSSSLGTTSADSAWAEEAWSAAHGYPRTVTQHQARLVFGGTRDLPQHVFASSTADLTNFDTDTTDDDKSYTKEIGTQNVNTITNIIGRNDIHIFTNDAHYVIVGEDAVTPTAGRVSQQNSPGCSTVQPAEFYQNLAFITDDLKTIQLIEYDSDVFQYKSSNLTTLSQDLLNNPTDMAYIQNYSNTQTNLLFIVNANGNAVCVSIDTEKEVFGFSSFTTNGFFISATEVDNDLYVLTQRIGPDGSTLKTHLEKLTEDELYLDHYYIGTTDTAKTDWTGATTLANQNVSLVAAVSGTDLDNAVVHNNVAVDGSGAFTIDYDAYAIAVGYGYDATVETLPIAFSVNNNLVRGERHRKVGAEVAVKNTKYFKCDGYQITDRRLGTSLLDTDLPALNTVVPVNLKGTTNNQTVTLLSDLPLPFQVNGLTVEVRFRA